MVQYRSFVVSDAIRSVLDLKDSMSRLSCIRNAESFVSMKSVDRKACFSDGLLDGLK